MKNSQKMLGQVFTPDYIVEMILDKIKYYGEKITRSYFLEPSFGTGNILIIAVQRFIKESLRLKKSPKEIETNLNKYFWGIEIDEEIFKETKDKLNDVLKSFNLKEISWDHLYNMDALDFNFNQKFDFIIGNPPYIRIHNISEEQRKQIQKFDFSDGMTDMYVIFFGFCINILSNYGKLGFITPNSYLTNKSQKKFRKYLVENKLIKEIIDFKEFQVFQNATTYTAITILSKQPNNFFKYSVYKKFERNIYFKNLIPGENLIFQDVNDEKFLNEISKKAHKISDYLDVQYGISTNKDSVYVGKLETKDGETFFNGEIVESQMFRPVTKGCEYEGEENITKNILFPYFWNKKEKKFLPFDETILEIAFPHTYKYLKKHKDELEKRDMETGTKWYQYARSQGIQKSNSSKWIIKHIFPEDTAFLIPLEASQNVIIYSGIFITPKEGIAPEKALEALRSPAFCRYCKLTGKHIHGNYISINTNIIKNYRFD